MRSSFLIIAVLFSSVAFGAWAGFAHVTPDTREKYGMPVCVSSIPGQPGLARVVFPLNKDSWVHAWLIITEQYFPPRKQNFREYIWSRSKDESRIQLRAKLHRMDDRDFAEVVISRATMSRAYIYIDYPREVYDGGWYYSIDLSTFVGIDEDEC